MNYIFTQNNGWSPYEKKPKIKKKNKKKKQQQQKNKQHERNNEQSKRNMPLHILWNWGIKYQNKPNICGNNKSLIRSWHF